MKLQIHIERLVLEGLSLNSIGCRQAQAAVQAELTRLLIESGLAHELQAGGAVPHRKAAEIAMTRRDKPAEVGKRIAGAIHNAIGTAPSTRGPRSGKPWFSTPHGDGVKGMGK
jgi:hypothetical protein